MPNKKIGRSRKTYKYVLLTIIMVLICAGSLTALYYINSYWYPPVLKFSSSDFINSVTFKTNRGDITISVDPRSKMAAAQFSRLIRGGFYTGTRIHRIVPDLLIEGGDPLTRYESEKIFWGQGGVSTVFKNETHIDDKMTEGTVCLTGSGTDTFGSQFFIITKDTPWLKGKHTIVGHVLSGMETVRLIEKSPHSITGLPDEDIILTGVTYE